VWVKVLTLRVAVKPGSEATMVTDWLNSELGEMTTVLDWAWTPEHGVEVPDDYKEGDFDIKPPITLLERNA
jgi:hypothetical protein